MLLLLVRLISASVVELFYSRNLTASYKSNNTEHPGVPEHNIIIIIIMRIIGSPSPEIIKLRSDWPFDWCAQIKIPRGFLKIKRYAQRLSQRICMGDESSR